MASTQYSILLQAYSTLSNPVSRLKYNAQLEQALKDKEDDYSGQLHMSHQAVAPLCLLEFKYAKSVFDLILAGQPLSKWLVGHRMGKNVDPAESRAVFVVSLPAIQGPGTRVTMDLLKTGCFNSGCPSRRALKAKALKQWCTQCVWKRPTLGSDAATCCG